MTPKSGAVNGTITGILFLTDQYPWRFDSIHPHCNDDVISILNILKEFCLLRTSATRSKKVGTTGNLPWIVIIHDPRTVLGEVDG
jgi:hypothetical protein